MLDGESAAPTRTVLTEVELEKARARTAIAKAAISAAEKKATAAIVAAAMPTFGALAATLNSRTSAVDQQLTTGAAAEAFGHMANRASNVDFAKRIGQRRQDQPGGAGRPRAFRQRRRC
ncbi:MAG: hypothetical protein IPJ28_10980 [Betaproteobacteria bacterium]|nr:hypothetical protein [Betaproteobacteria bacterium]